MGLFGKRKSTRNKNAASAPKVVRDYYPAIDFIAGKEATAYSAIDLIADAVSQLSFGVFDSKTREAKKRHWLYEVVKQPNLDETHTLFFSQLVRDWYSGGCFLYHYKNEDGRVVSLFRLDPGNVLVKRDDLNRKTFMYNGYAYHSDRVLHIPNKYGYNGLVGRSIFRELPNIFETSMQLDNYVQNTFNQNMGKRLVIDTTEAFQDLNDEQKEQLENKFVNKYGGVKNAGRPVVKSGGIKFETLDTGTNSNQASELAANREYQTKLVAEVFHVPVEFLVGDVPAEIESLYTVFCSLAVQPVAKIFEEYINLLLSPEERERVFFEFSYNSLLKTSLTKRIDAYTKQLTNGQLTIDEIRKKENLPELGTASANTLLVPANLMPVRDDIFDAYMASAKEKLKNIENKIGDANDNDTNGIGDDKK